MKSYRLTVIRPRNLLYCSNWRVWTVCLAACAASLFRASVYLLPLLTFPEMARSAKMEAQIEWPKIYFFGDSLTQLSFSSDGGWASIVADNYSRRADVIIRGFSGYNTRMARAILPHLKREINQASISGIFLGANDASDPVLNPLQGLSLDEYVANLEFIVKEFKKVQKMKCVFVITPPPLDELAWARYMDMNPSPRTEAVTAQFADACCSVAQMLQVPCIHLHREMIRHPNWRDFLVDGLHFNAKGSEFVGALVVDMLKRCSGIQEDPILPLWSDVDYRDVGASMNMWIDENRDHISELLYQDSEVTVPEMSRYRETKVQIEWPQIFFLGASIVQVSFSSDGGWGSIVANNYARRADVIIRGFSGYNTRMARAILPHLKREIDQASISGIFLGANDASDPVLNPLQGLSLDEYVTNLEFIVNEFKKGQKMKCVFVITPPALDESAWVKTAGSNPAEKSEVLTAQFADACCSVAQTLQVPCIHLHREMMRHPNWRDFLVDGLHFNVKGSEFFGSLVVDMMKRCAGIEEDLVFPLFSDMDYRDSDSSVDKWIDENRDHIS